MYYIKSLLNVFYGNQIKKYYLNNGCHKNDSPVTKIFKLEKY